MTVSGGKSGIVSTQRSGGILAGGKAGRVVVSDSIEVSGSSGGSIVFEKSADSVGDSEEDVTVLSDEDEVSQTIKNWFFVIMIL